MIVDAAELADFPADGHALEDDVFEDEVAGVIAFGPEEIFLDGLGADLMGDDEILDVIESEITIGEGGEFPDPVGDVHLRGSYRIGHKRPRAIITERAEDERESWERDRKSVV